MNSKHLTAHGLHCGLRRSVLALWAGSLLATSALSLRAADVVWQEDFESTELWDRWYIEGAVWEVGVPTAGPGKPHGGQRCAATVPNGDYPPSADARLIREKPFVVHPAELQPRLRFWHWNSNYPEDPCTVEVKPVGGEWKTISREYVWRTSVYSRTTLDLSEFAGQSVTIAFRFRSNDDAEVSAGWYVDDVEYVTGVPEFNIIDNPERFDNGLGDWDVDGGDWEVRMPPKSTQQYDGWNYKYTSCAGTVLTDPDENDPWPTVYHVNLDSRLISPEFTVPPTEAYPRFRFWQLTGEWLGDICRVEIRALGGPWHVLSPEYPHSFTWTPATLDLREFAGQRVQIAFHLKSNQPDFPLEQTCWSGWYVDDVEVVTGKPASLDFEGFETGYGDWEIEGWLDWQVGDPSERMRWSKPPLFGRSCAGTYGGGDTRLVSPEFEVPIATEYPRLRFWHWSYTYWSNGTSEGCVSEAPCVVDIKPTNGDWQPLSGGFTHASQPWTRATLDLRPFAGQTVRIAFHRQQNSTDSCWMGWYIDNVEVVKGRPEFMIVNHPERFDNGLEEWNVTGGDWEVGTPTAGPSKAFSGSFCAGTVLDGHYDPFIETMLVSPEFVVPLASEHPRLRFWHWYDTAFVSSEPKSAGGRVYVGPPGALVSPSDWPSYAGSNRAWTRATLDLAEYAGQNVQLAFAFVATGDTNTAAGWYVDDVEVVSGRVEFSLVNHPEGFESGLGDWEVVPANWQAGKPTVGPSAAFNGTNCVGTVLEGNYGAGVDTRLVSPEFVLPCVEAAPRLRFAHWFSLAAGDTATVEVRELPGGTWTPVVEGVAGSSADWSVAGADLAAYAGKRVQLAFRLNANADGTVGPGWYVDEVRILADLAEALPDRRVAEGELVSFPINPRCPNVKYRLGAGAPPGAALDPDLGLFTWVPDACQGPAIYVLQFSLVDPDSDLVVGFVTNRIEVLGENPPPVFGDIPPLAIRAGVPVAFRASDYADDASCPVQRLTYTLDAGSPTNAGVEPETGRIDWTPTLEQACRTHLIHLRVTDDGDPPRSAIAVVEAWPKLVVTGDKSGDGQIEFTVEGGSPGARCELLAATHVPAATAEWTVLEQRTWPESGSLTFQVRLGSDPARYYQVRVLPP